jgi:Flp pilus assembly CpaE family ATPase
VISLSRKKKEEPLLRKSAIIGVLGSKGGVGATTVAANMQQPDVALWLACEARHTMVELLQRSANLEPQTIAACCTPAPTYAPLRVLTAATDGGTANTHTLTQLSACLPSLQMPFRQIVVDLPKHLDRHLVSVLDRCDVVVLIIEPSLTSIAATNRWLHIFDELGYGREKILLVANRTGGKHKILDEQLQATYADSLAGKIPNAFALMEASAIAALPIVISNPREAYSKAIKAVSAKVTEKLEPAGQGEEINV